MPFFEGTYSSNGSEFPYSSWLPEDGERGRVYLLHGMGSAPSEFAVLGEFLARLGISLFAPAIRGQGFDPVQSRRGTEVNVSMISWDLKNFLEATPTKSPRYLCGESMGAMLAVQALRHPDLASTFRGGLLLCPVVELRRKTPGWMISLVHLLARIVPGASLHPGLFIHGKAEAPKLTEDLEYQSQLAKAPFRLPKVGLGFFSGISKLMESSRMSGEKLSVPIILLIGGKDPYLSDEQSRAWFKTIASADKKLRVFPDSHHLLLHDRDTPQVMEEIQKWLDEQLRKESSGGLI